MPVKTFEEFRMTIVPMLLALGPYSSDDPVLLYKTLRIMKSALGIVSNNLITVFEICRVCSVRQAGFLRHVLMAIYNGYRLHYRCRYSNRCKIIYLMLKI